MKFLYRSKINPSLWYSKAKQDKLEAHIMNETCIYIIISDCLCLNRSSRFTTTVAFAVETILWLSCEDLANVMLISVVISRHMITRFVVGGEDSPTSRAL